MSLDIESSSAAPAPPGAPAPSPAELAAKYGLSVSGARPTLRAYVRQLWGRRHFISAFSRARVSAQYTQARLGQLWQVLTPLLNAAVYYFIFGLLLGTDRGV
ncbi:ABC transporter permease, partial [Streptomyces sp. NPDC058864]